MWKSKIDKDLMYQVAEILCERGVLPEEVQMLDLSKLYLALEQRKQKQKEAEEVKKRD